MIKETVVAKDKNHFKKLINDYVYLHNDECDLNYIDVSNIIDMSDLFEDSKFNGDISSLDVSNVSNMAHVFYNSIFNQDISNWNTSNVTDIRCMFDDCPAPIPWWFIEDNKLRTKAIDNFNL